MMMIGLSYSTAQHFTFNFHALPQKNQGAHFIASAPGAKNPSYDID